MNTTASTPFFVPSNPSARVSKSWTRSLNPVVQAFEVVIGTASIAAGAVVTLGLIHALITLV